MAKAKQYAERVNVIKMVKVNRRWRFAPVVERNGKIVRDHVLVKGRDEHHPGGRYYLEWYEDGRRHREPVAAFDLVLAAARAKSIQLNARRAGMLPSAKPPVGPSTARITIAAAIDKYLEYIKVQRSLRTYRPTLSAMARELVEKAGVGESADALWRELDHEREKVQPHPVVAEPDPEQESAPVLDLPMPGAAPPAPVAFGIHLTEPSPSNKRRRKAELWPTATETDPQLSLFDLSEAAVNLR